MEQGDDFYVVRKGNMVAVYKNLEDCQAQVNPSVHAPAVSAYKGCLWSRENEEYLSSHGLSNALYTMDATELKEDMFGALVPYSFEMVSTGKTHQLKEMMGSSSNRSAFSKKPDDLRYDYEAKPMFQNHEGAAPDKAFAGDFKKPISQGYSLATLPFHKQEVTSSPSARASQNKVNLGYTILAEPISQQHMICLLEFDGGAKGNPGKAGAGAVLKAEDGRVISRLREGLGVTTNNVAEYRGLILGLRYASMKGFKRIKVQDDSQLICMQVKGAWKINKEHLMELCKEVNKLKEKFVSFEINHVRREWNADADRQANIGITLPEGEVCEEHGDAF